MRWVAAALVAIGLGVSPAHGQVHGLLHAELRLGAGYDDNLFLDARPAGVPTSQVRADAIFDIAPRLEARLWRSGHWFGLTADFLERVTPSTGDLRDLTLRLDYATPPLGPIALFAAGLYEYYGASLYPEDTFHLGGGEAGLRLLLLDRLRLTALYRADARAYSDPSRATQVDFEQRATAALHARPHRTVTIDVSYSFLHVASNNPQAALERHGASAALMVRPTRWLLFGAGYGVAYQQLSAGMLDATHIGPRDDLLQTAEVSVVARPLRWLELFARYGLVYSSSSAPAGDYQRDQAQAGVSLLFDAERVWTRPRPAAPELHGARVTFRYLGRARQVSVVGDWNRWDASAAPLSPVAEGRFEVQLDLPPGRHEYALSVDGVITRPPDAPGYRADGFGGDNGVVSVP